MQVISHSIAETLVLGRRIGALAPLPPAVTCIALDGQLGAGKTHLTRGIAEGAGVADATLVSSPTYVLLNIYPGPKPVYHLDAYRVQSAEDFAALGFEELLTAWGGGGIVVVEWAEKVIDLLPADRLHVQLQHAGESVEDTRRIFEFSATGPASAGLLVALAAI